VAAQLEQSKALARQEYARCRAIKRDDTGVIINRKRFHQIQAMPILSDLERLNFAMHVRDTGRESSKPYSKCIAGNTEHKLDVTYLLVVQKKREMNS
jgi:hypothetical protein